MTSVAGASASRAEQVRVFPTLEGLLAELDDRTPFKTPDSLSGSRFESARYRDEPVVLKYVSVDDDWIMRATGDIDCRLLRVFSHGLVDRVPESIDHVTVALAPYPSAHGHRGAAVLLREVGELLIPAGDAVVDLDAHLRFLGHMAQLHAAFWGWTDDVGLIPLAHHYTTLSPVMSALEAARGGTDPVPGAVMQGWEQLQRVAPRMAKTLNELSRDPSPLVGALAATPQTFVHGDWKFGNLGERPEGRTILLDWDRCGAAPATLDLAWYLAVNCDRLPQSKEETIYAYRAEVERCGVDTTSWWDVQLSLTLCGAALQLGWSKVGDAPELGWWADRVAEGVQHLA